MKQSAAVSGLKYYKPRSPIIHVRNWRELEALVLRLEKEEVIALDIETTVSESPARIGLIQIADCFNTWIIDATAVGDLTLLKRVFENPDIVKVIHYSKFETGVLGGYGIGIENIFDTCTVSRSLRGKVADGHNLGAVCRREIGFDIDKTLQTSDWLRRPLTEEQIAYAAVDAEVLMKLHSVFIRAAVDAGQ